MRLDQTHRPWWWMADYYNQALNKLEIKMRRKSLQKPLIGIASAAVIGAMSSGAMAEEKVTDWRVG